MNALSFLARCFLPGVQRRNDPSWGLLRTLQAVTMLSVIAVRASAATNEVTLNGFSFSPASLTISAGDTVIFKNTGGFHNSVCETNDPFCGSFAAAKPSPWSYTNRFDVPGTYKYRCTIHSPDFNSGMIFGITVLPADQHVVTLVNFKFDPPSLTIPAGDTVIFRKTEGFHDAVCEQKDPYCGSFTPPSGSNWSLTN